jgi:hypothetical protein
MTQKILFALDFFLDQKVKNDNALFCLNDTINIFTKKIHVESYKNEWEIDIKPKDIVELKLHTNGKEHIFWFDNKELLKKMFVNSVEKVKKYDLSFMYKTFFENLPYHKNNNHMNDIERKIYEIVKNFSFHKKNLLFTYDRLYDNNIDDSVCIKEIQIKKHMFYNDLSKQIESMKKDIFNLNLCFEPLSTFFNCCQLLHEMANEIYDLFVDVLRNMLILLVATDVMYHVNKCLTTIGENIVDEMFLIINKCDMAKDIFDIDKYVVKYDELTVSRDKILMSMCNSYMSKKVYFEKKNEFLVVTYCEKKIWMFKYMNNIVSKILNDVLENVKKLNYNVSSRNYNLNFDAYDIDDEQILSIKNRITSISDFHFSHIKDSLYLMHIKF